MEQITIKEIAKLCKVGVSTVSRAINNHPDINPETKEMILDTIREYGYVPNNSARNLKRSESNTIAILVKGVNNPLFADMIRWIESDILGKQYLFVLQQVEDEEKEAEVALRLEKEKRLKGIVFLGGASSHERDCIRQLKIPYVICTINSKMPEDIENYGVVAIDDELESYRMVDHLCRCGHKRIAILTTYAHDTSVGKLRLNGYRRALEDHGIEYDESLVIHMDRNEQTYTIRNGYEVTKKLLKSGLSFSCIFAITDMLAIGACKAVFDAGLRVPEDISVAGFDGIDMGEFYQPSITTIEQPVREMAKEAGKILFDLIQEGGGGSRRKTFEAKLREGQSVKRTGSDETA